MAQPRILVADDEELFRLVVVNALEDGGYQTIEAADGNEALERIESERPDLVLLDLNMPNVDGWTVIDRVLEKEDKPRIIVMTGAGDRDVAGSRVDCLSGFLTKPFQAMTLLRTCEVALQSPLVIPPQPSRKELRRTFVCGATVAVTPNGRLETGRLLEISTGGFRLESTASIAVGDRLQISLAVPGRSHVLQLNGRVRWQQDSMIGGSVQHMNPEDAELLQDLVSVLR